MSVLGMGELAANVQRNEHYDLGLHIFDMLVPLSFG